MLKKTIKLNTIDDVKEINQIAESCIFDVDLSIDRYVIDAKSIMGIFSLNLSKKLTLTIYSDNETHMSLFEKWIIE